MTSPVSLTYAAARERVLAAVRPLPPERAPLEDCSGRALREPLVADHALPPFRNTAMDGFAVRSADLAAASEAHPVSLRVVEVLPAGRAPARALAPGEAARIMTGAMLPEGADAIVPFEDAARSGAGDGERCEVRRAAAAGEHVRDAGVDVARGETVLPAGRQLSPQDLALAAALGHPKLAVSPRIRVALFSTGDELLDVDEPLRPGAIRDSNLLMMALLLRASGGVLTLAERLPDDVAHVTARVRDALAASDVVLTIGGVSAGDFDPVREALAKLGSIEAWRVAMRPGRPQAFGTPGGKVFYGMPGNPASVACVFETLVRPAMRVLQGFTQLDRPRVPVRVAERVESRAGRTDFVRATLTWRDDGFLWASPAGAQVSGHLSPQSRAHGLLLVPEASERLEPGDRAHALVMRPPAS
ncbi:MAG TPA: gephyrin-like molybdotransferase Glp [Verrucomicrobiae bacterium]|jgi:molybdopterin molybdotransferase|nr:gephyrin-like molybdotransferase Glp [Verrucomicrobiae bacterium]